MEETLLREILGEIKGIRNDVSTLKSDVGVLKSDVGILKSDVSELKSDVSVLKEKVDILEGKSDEQRDLLLALEHRAEENSALLYALTEEVNYIKGDLQHVVDNQKNTKSSLKGYPSVLLSMKQI